MGVKTPKYMSAVPEEGRAQFRRDAGAARRKNAKKPKPSARSKSSAAERLKKLRKKPKKK